MHFLHFTLEEAIRKFGDFHGYVTKMTNSVSSIVQEYSMENWLERQPYGKTFF